MVLNKSSIEYGCLVTPFAYSTKNRFFVVGCDSEGYNTGHHLLKENEYYNECKTSCDSKEKVQEGGCNGHGCCNRTVLKGTKMFWTEVDQTDGTTFLSFSPCTYAFVDYIPGYGCSCSKGYKGKPYLSPGCQDVNECEDINNNPCSNNEHFPMLRVTLAKAIVDLWECGDVKHLYGE
ncbi:wall-associated receptor kinase 1-like isoform X2 [Papaver somniferum]|uniref:wall-associated receptor kinase 1-like isoform X2 n=1 Tax=Papaver somniferum TaxID=3469 RepID=UPI000E6F84C3|nr:wall-associated receptor kinase 1-like isoform X2 [Papaver somniferum]